MKVRYFRNPANHFHSLRFLVALLGTCLAAPSPAQVVFDAATDESVPSVLRLWSNGAKSLSLAEDETGRVLRIQSEGSAAALVIGRECPIDATVLEFTYFLPSNAPVRSINAGMRVKEDGGRQTQVRLAPVFGQWRTERLPIARFMRGDIWRAGTATTAQSLEIGIVSGHGPFQMDVARIEIAHEEGPSSPMVRPMRLIGSGTFARRFEVAGEPRKAWLMALGRPRFRAVVNGREVGCGTFTNAGDWPCRGETVPVAAEFSLEDVLRGGENEVELIVESGDSAECAAVIGWEDEDGRHHVVATDASWLRDGGTDEVLPPALRATPLSEGGGTGGTLRAIPLSEGGKTTGSPPFWDIYPVRPPVAWCPPAERMNPATAPEVVTRSPLLKPAVTHGRWGTERRADGRWFLTTPTGASFFLYGIQTVNCFRQNYGYLDWARRAYATERDWASDAVAFVQRLGYNAVGVAASARSAFDAAAARGMLNLEYIGCADGGPFLVNAQGKRLVGLCDPFDPEFRRRLRERLVAVAPGLNARPAVFGICVGNEAHIEGNVASISSSGYVYSEACGREFVRWLRERYDGDVALLNRAWFGSRESEWLQTFDEVLERKPDPFDGRAPVIDDPEYVAAMAHLGRPVSAGADGAPKGAMREDFDAFAVHTVRIYAETVLDLMREFFPDKLIGSNRFLGGATEEMYRCWSNYDIIAVNSYPMSVWGDTVFTERQMDLIRLAHRATGRPVVLTEWGVQAMDIAMQSPSATLWTQAERGRGYGKALRQVVEELPFVAGVVAFGFQNLADSEGQGWGLVDNEGRPYRDYVEGVADAARWLDRYFAPPRVTTSAPGWVFTEDEHPSFVAAAPSAEQQADTPHAESEGETPRTPRTPREVNPNSAWRLLDWRGREVRRGEWPADGQLELEPLPPGFYRVETATPLVTRHSSLVTSAAVPPFDFCVVRRDPCRNPDSPFAVDSALSHRAKTFDCPWYDGNTFRVVCELMRKCGVVQTRERMSWSGMNPERGVYNYGRRLDNVEHLRANGLVTTGIYGDTPAHAGGMVRGKRHLPVDLMELRTFMTNAVPTFGDAYNAWGFWNEPDLAMVPEPVWEYVAAFKAFALSVRDADSAKPVLFGALADVPDPDFGEGLAANELVKFTDAFNIHTYLEPARLPQWIANLRTFMATCGRPELAVWLTEFGTNLEGDSTEDGVWEGLKAHSLEQEMVCAEWYPKGAIMMQMGGIARSWLFLFGCYNERGGRKDWGTMRRDGHVKPICAALSTLTGELGDARLLGEVKVGEGVRAFLYTRDGARESGQSDGARESGQSDGARESGQSDGARESRQPADGGAPGDRAIAVGADRRGARQTLVFWSVSEIDTLAQGPVHPEEVLERPFEIEVKANHAVLPPALRTTPLSEGGESVDLPPSERGDAPEGQGGVLRLVDMMGSPLPAPSTMSGGAPVSLPMPPSARGDAPEGQGGVLRLVAERYPQYLTGPLGLVPDIPATPPGRVCRYEAAPDEDLSVVVRPKLSERDFEIVGHKSRAELVGESGDISVELWNFSHQEKRGRLTVGTDTRVAEAVPSAADIVLPPLGHVAIPYRYSPPADGPLDALLSFRFESSDGVSTRAAVPVFDRPRFLAGCEVVPLALEDPTVWRRNDSGQSYSCTYDEIEKAVRFDVGWTGETGPWFMPWHDLKLPEESFADAKMLEFEVKSEQDKVENDYNSAVFMPTWADGHAVNIHYPSPGFAWEKRRVALPPDAGGIVSFRLGGAPRGRRLTFWLRNVRLLREAK